jgi:hypothetical protein
MPHRMNNFYQSWLDQRGRLPGVLACGVCLADQNCLSLSNSEAFPADRVEQLMRQMVDYPRNLAMHRITANRLVWTFENARLHWALRDNGVSLGLFTPADLPEYEAALIEQVIEEFLGLTDI